MTRVAISKEILKSITTQVQPVHRDSILKLEMQKIILGIKESLLEYLKWSSNNQEMQHYTTSQSLKTLNNLTQK